MTPEDWERLARQVQYMEEYKPSELDHEAEQCENCNRNRVELCSNGRLICEKCHWDQDDHKYDCQHLESRDLKLRALEEENTYLRDTVHMYRRLILKWTELYKELDEASKFCTR